MLRKLTRPARVIAFGFAALILLGALLLSLPVSHNDGVSVSFLDALFTSTSAVCVTGLVLFDTARTFSGFGCVVIAALIQIGGLGVALIGVSLIMLSRKKINLQARRLASESMNFGTLRGVLAMVKSVLIITACFEVAGMVLSFAVFSKDYPFWKALGISAFHAVSAFNNAGFDILGNNMQSLSDYRSNVLLNLVTCGLIIFGGLGFFVIRELVKKRSFRKFSLHTKVVLVTTAALLAGGTLLIWATEDVTWLNAFFTSTVARTAGFSTVPMSGFTNAGLLTTIMLMFIGASSGSTGGGIKTTTFFILIQAAFAASTNRSPQAFKRRLPYELLHRALIIALLAGTVVIVGTFLLCISQPKSSFINLLFETMSAFGTVGLSVGETPGLARLAKLVLISIMYIGRLGPLTVASLWIIRPTSAVSFPVETLTIG